MKKKYTVFVSSTYEDLKEERQEVMRVLLEADCIPCGMEYFPATDDSTLDFIKRIIDDCDYYVLILGGKYGSTDSSGQSYTEKEYLYAQEKGIPTLSFLRNNLKSLSADLCEDTAKKRRRLNQFRELAKENKICKFWSNKDELARRVLQSISQIIRDAPGAGWVRADFPVEKAIAAMNDYDECGVRRLYPKGHKIESFEQMLASPACRRFRMLAYSGVTFTLCYKNELKEFLASGGEVQYLLSNPKTVYLEQASSIHHRNQASHIAADVDSCIQAIQSILEDAESLAKKKGTRCGSFEVRFFDTELRNQLLICDDEDGNQSAWLTVLLPPLGAVNCTMIEYEKTDNCVQYFDTIWNRHAGDKVAL